MYSPPTTPQLNPDVHENLLQCLDEEIQAHKFDMMKLGKNSSMKGGVLPFMTHLMIKNKNNLEMQMRLIQELFNNFNMTIHSI